MRTLAARLGVRASSLYRHFPDRGSIEGTLASRASERLLTSMQTSIQGLSGERALFSASRAYLDFSVSESPFYDMLMQAGLPGSDRSAVTAQLWTFFVELVSSTTHFSDDVAGAAALWSFLHGFSLLSRTAQLGQIAPRLTFARGTQALVRGLSVADAESARGSLS